MTKKLAEVTSIWGKLQTSHCVYCRHAGIGISSTESREYLREQGKVKEEGDMTAETALGEEDPDNVTARRLKRAINTLQSEVGFAIPAIEGLADEVGKAARWSTTCGRSRMTRRWIRTFLSSLDVAHAQLSALLSRVLAAEAACVASGCYAVS